MFQVYDEWPQIARKSFEIENEPITLDVQNDIVFSGMGGSGAIGNVFAAILSKSKIHVDVVKGYLLPKTVDSKTIVIVVSISGNTEETLATLESAHKIGCKIIAFSSGGKISKYCKENKIKHFMIPQYHSPRASFTSFLYTILNTLHDSLKIKHSDIIESIKELEDKVYKR